MARTPRTDQQRHTHGYGQGATFYDAWCRSKRFELAAARGSRMSIADAGGGDIAVVRAHSPSFERTAA